MMTATPDLTPQEIENVKKLLSSIDVYPDAYRIADAKKGNDWCLMLFKKGATDWIYCGYFSYDKADRDMFSALKKNASAVFNWYEQIKDIYHWTPEWTELRPVKDEICKAIFAGLYLPAVLTITHWMEDILKAALIYNELPPPLPGEPNTLKQTAERNRKVSDKYTSLNMSETIGKCRNRGLISKPTAKQLTTYLKDVRNSYFHADNKLILGDKTQRMAMFSFTDITKYEVQEVNVHDMRLFIGQAKIKAAFDRVIGDFTFAKATLHELATNVNVHHAKLANQTGL